MSIPGVDLLGIAKTPDSAIDAIPIGFAVGLLEITFGDTTKKLNRALKRKPGAIRAHLTDGTGQRNHNAEPGAPKETDWDAYIKGAKKYEAIKKANPGVAVYISPRLEYDCKDQAIVKRWFSIIKQFAPSCIPVASAFSGWIPSGVLVERHGNKAKGDLTSNDGESLSDAGPEYHESGRLITFGWLHTMNGRGPGDDGFTPPSKRPLTAFCDVHDIKYCEIWLTRVQGKSDVKPPEILKPYAEYYSLRDDWRERKNMYASKVRVNGWEVWANGKKIGQFKHYPGLLNGLHRYYCTDYPDTIFAKAKGSTVVLKSGNQKVTLDCIYRTGKMR